MMKCAALTVPPQTFAPSGKENRTGHSAGPDGPASLAGTGRRSLVPPRPVYSRQAAASAARVCATCPARSDPGWAAEDDCSVTTSV